MENGAVTMGVGGGIVYDSDPAAEYAECLLKAAFLTRSQPPFDLIETLLWRDGYALLPLHLDRLRLSCEYFDRPFDSAEIEVRLHALAATFAPLSRHRVRLTLDPREQIALTSSPLAPNAETCRVTLAAERTTSTDVFLRHKTTHRPLYDRLFAAAERAGFDEVLFFNQSPKGPSATFLSASRAASARRRRPAAYCPASSATTCWRPSRAPRSAFSP
jgi:para-aminobenzoate synthetase/4-amino-4-deoxychorismate lyase